MRRQSREDVVDGILCLCLAESLVGVPVGPTCIVDVPLDVDIERLEVPPDDLDVIVPGRFAQVGLDSVGFAFGAVLVPVPEIFLDQERRFRGFPHALGGRRRRLVGRSGVGRYVHGPPFAASVAASHRAVRSSVSP